MKHVSILAALLLSLASAAYANTGENVGTDAANYAHVGQIRYLGRLNGWRRIDDSSLIIWTSPFQPYLVELSRKSRDLKFANRLAITSSAGSISEKFDSVIVDGLRYRIEAIYKLDRQTARNLTRKS
jgi:hypothetical protein